MRRTAVAVFAVVLCAGSAAADQCETSANHWSYEGGAGPACWARIGQSANRLCSQGQAQSPIDLRPDEAREGGLMRGTQSYEALPLTVLNNGHAIEIPVPPGQTFKPAADESEFTLKQVHFHSPSEHQIDGKTYPLEAHLVHEAADGRLLVRGVLFEEGDSHPWLSELTRGKLPAKGETIEMDAKVDPSALVDSEDGYFVYSGSLTTPGCSEGVIWHVRRDLAEARAAEIETLREALGFENARPVQALNGRTILYVRAE